MEIDSAPAAAVRIHPSSAPHSAALYSAERHSPLASGHTTGSPPRYIATHGSADGRAYTARSRALPPQSRCRRMYRSCSTPLAASPPTLETPAECPPPAPAQTHKPPRLPGHSQKPQRSFVARSFPAAKIVHIPLDNKGARTYFTI